MCKLSAHTVELRDSPSTQFMHACFNCTTFGAFMHELGV